ncbi:hypothetical protein VTN77DRAFT_534 [Rasamsonia byssochlamydoides]|uniref:uncharacterized protein n=1 Tax=Rasamsonia byssochlamydoides TaxID=89139 RepID=UPI0037447A33
MPISVRTKLLLLLLSISLVSPWSPVLAIPPSSRPQEDLGRVFDYVIVGGGPGGLTVANRLSENASVSVAVIEAGTFYEDVVGNQSQVPGYDFRYDGKSPNYTIPFVDWGFLTTPQASIDGQIFHYVRGKALGGSTALNYMTYTLPAKGALQRWADAVGDPSYTYDNVVQYYRKSMNFTPPDMATRWANSTPAYNPADTATGGPLAVSYAAFAQSWSTWAAKALEAIGIRKTDAFINGNLNGSSWMMHTIDHSTGFRASAEAAFLRPYLDRPNLAVFNGTLGERILFDDDKVARGVQVTTGNTTYTLSATREVIVAGGAFQTPQLLQVSGVGPAALLRQHGIPVVADRPGVGQGMNDHVFFGIAYRVNLQTATSLSYGDNLQIAIDQFNTNATGPLTSPGGDYAGLEKLPAEFRANFSAATLQTLAELPEDWPEIEYLVLPSYVGNLESPDDTAPLDGSNYATFCAALVAPASRGNVSIASSRMSDPPLINPNWLTAPSDLELLTAAFKRVRQAFTSSVLANVTIGDEFFPGASVQTDEQILRQLKAGFSPLFHASATCQMGKPDNELAVVDSHARVYGVKNLRIVDASAFPFLPPDMLAEKIADDIKNGN